MVNTMTTENDPRFPICLVLDLTSCDADFEEDALSFFNGEMAEDHWMYAKFTEIFAGMTSFEYSNSVIDFMRGLETEAFNFIKSKFGTAHEHGHDEYGLPIMIWIDNVEGLKAAYDILGMDSEIEHLPCGYFTTGRCFTFTDLNRTDTHLSVEVLNYDWDPLFQFFPELEAHEEEMIRQAKERSALYAFAE
jgi:hypothetical protein